MIYATASQPCRNDKALRVSNCGKLEKAVSYNSTSFPG